MQRGWHSGPGASSISRKRVVHTLMSIGRANAWQMNALGSCAHSPRPLLSCARNLAESSGAPCAERATCP